MMSFNFEVKKSEGKGGWSLWPGKKKNEAKAKEAAGAAAKEAGASGAAGETPAKGGAKSGAEAFEETYEKTEKVGDVTMVLDYYPGEDFYTDGEIEDRMLEIAKETGAEGFDKAVEEEKSWPILYHFSPIRQNILRWYPLKAEDKVLEIGAGCGAITGALTEKAGRVDAVDLSKKRSLVNAYRNRECGNLRLFLGNFETVEPHLPRDYSVITLIGVLEYGELYIEGEEPFKAFLEKVRGHLAPGGTLLVAIENRLGMKYFAGCTEDHTGHYFEGIEGYREGSRAKTFSKPALEKLLASAGFKEQRFFYPYPDYKFPMAVYSDESLPKKGELTANRMNFDRQRMVLFNETKAYDTMIEDGLFPLFANSFLVEAKE